MKPCQQSGGRQVNLSFACGNHQRSIAKTMSTEYKLMIMSCSVCHIYYCMTETPYIHLHGENKYGNTSTHLSVTVCVHVLVNRYDPLLEILNPDLNFSSSFVAKVVKMDSFRDVAFDSSGNM